MMRWIRALACAATCGLIAVPALAQAGAESEAAAPLVIGQRTIHVFRAPAELFSPAERAAAARRRVEDALLKPGEGWTSVRAAANGFVVELDGAALFVVLPGDARTAAGETPEALANQASRVLQKAWAEARESRDPKARIESLLRVGVAAVLLLLVLAIVVKLAGLLRTHVVAALRRWIEQRLANRLGEGAASVSAVPGLLDKSILLATWLVALALVFAFLAYGLAQFVITRPASEMLTHSTAQLMRDAVHAAAASVPGIFVAALVFTGAWVVTRVLGQVFVAMARRPANQPGLNEHTAPATRRIVNALLWLFALAMAYPYLPGSQTEAFKGLSVVIGLMVSIGAAGVVGQIASGMIIVYTYALKAGDYVRIQEHEGTVTEVSLFVTRLRTGLGEEVAIPNAVVLGSVTRNLSRVAGSGYMLDVNVTIGYDTPWRQVHALLIEAAQAIPEILKEPPPFVVQTALSDFYVAYKLVVHVDTAVPATRARVASDLHAAIQDSFNRHGVQIMSPHYYGDPQTAKLVPPANWRPPPVRGESVP